MEKAHGSDSGTTVHIERFIIPKNADPTRIHLNRRLIGYPDGVKDRSAAVQRRLEEAGLTRKIGSNQVRAIRINVSGTHEDMKRIEEEGRLDEWCADNLKYFVDTFGKENIVAAHLHRDEETPHIHVTLVPIVKGERKRRKREEQTNKRYRKKPTDTVRLCADEDIRHKQEISFLKAVIARVAAWFPYFREMLRIENLCRLVGFDERQTATLVKGKSLEYAGELYSEEHGRKFTTEKVGFQVLKDPTDGTKLVLAIDRKPIAEWFKEQFEKLRQNIRRPIQPQRKGRGI
ncbi:putative plasmid recombination enzyme [Hoylesella marshii DSM 16973 = JCM 13450]|uniref:Plasmid recombination enzyme n=2 Tax=Hoylesella marshii TaxID=189722 RepID=E0NU19_9BACT|nr:putative plasmid recombination enzyme [Hoylesella marshii DSM 16973 = JCM 13450]